MAQATNNRQINFPTPTADWAAASWGSVWNNTTFIGKSQLNAAITAVNGSPTFIPAGSLVVEIPDGEFGGAQTDDLLENRAMATGPIRMGLHTGDPGANGTANELTGGSYARASEPVAQFTFS